MRVGLVLYGSLDTLSGGYLYDRKLVEHLRAQGDDVEVISLPPGGYARHLADNLTPGLARRLSGYDILLQDELNHPSLAWANGRHPSRPPTVAIVHHLRCSERWPDWQRRAYAAVERRYLRSVDAFVFNSETTRQAVEALAGGGRPSVVAYPGGDRFTPSITPATAAARAQDGPLRLVFVGNLIPRKALHVLLDALARLSSEAWHLTVIGRRDADPAYARRVEARLRDAALAGRVTLAGPLSDAELAGRLAESHVLVVPSSYEGFGIVYLEGMAFGLPAVATTAGAAHEIITDGENGFLVAPDNPHALAARINVLARDRDRLAGMSRAALARYANHPTWGESAARIRAFLLSLLP